ncbi:cytochrome c biogenesis CcdA family protein [Desulfitobacterium metallireducens]|uniref:Cytochrome C biogenesis protein DsbD n=1 Tax=Desulfitobacterium metallireducens DSM 15288 TaxID=871968 RepID=W0E730_9FIRM|nr:cytochrome c biogenesis protein CcdA [Desulfitobacterium metallireducens]AHF06582.1 cytochrome C biogenesis protein DsbD [Desulfitobacterium metallireducens DSM 15288]
MENISVLFAFTAGMLSFLSPCVFPLIPAYVANLTGSTYGDTRIEASKRVLFTRSVAFILGFSLIFVLMGASASVVGRLFADYRGLIQKISGILIIIFGLQMAGVLKLRFLMMEKRWEGKPAMENSVWRSLLLGVSFGAGWTPCVGLALSSILLLAGSAETVYSGMFLLFIYSLGLGIPFLAISLIITYSFKVVKAINSKLGILSSISGWILVGMGILLFSGQLRKMSAWLSQFTLFFY